MRIISIPLFNRLIILCILILLFGSSNLVAQKSTPEFDSVYLHIASNMGAVNIDESISRTDSLLAKSKTNFQKMKSYLLLALLNEGKGELANAISWATQTETLAIAEKDYEYQVRAAGYLATLYRRIDLTVESNRHIQIAEKANAQRKEESNYFEIQSVIHHEKSLYYVELGKYDKALIELDKSVECIKKLEDSPRNKYSLATIYETYSECYLYIEAYEKAKEKAEKGLELAGRQDPELYSLLQHHLGIVAIHYKDYDLAFEHLQNAEEASEKSQRLSLQFIVYSGLAKYYKARGDYKNTVYYTDKISKIKDKRSLFIKEVSNEIVVNLQSKEEAANKNIQYLIGFSLFLALLIITIVVLWRQKHKNQIIKYERLTKRSEEYENQAKERPILKSENDLTKENFQSNPLMTSDTEERLLSQLATLENTNFFLNKDVSLTSLSSELNSNTKYVSHVINKHKNKDFNNYINELRVFYVIRLLREKPEYLKYKLAYIAEQTGFSSHSKFTAVFRNITGITPSTFIEQMKSKVDSNNGSV